METFGEWLLQARKGAKLTQEELARRAGCSKSYIGTLENAYPSSHGEPVRPDADLVDRLADALDESRSSARVLAGYAPTSVTQEPALPLARRLHGILRKVPADKQPAFEAALLREAENWASLLAA